MSAPAEVTIGWFGPSDPAHPLHGDLWAAAVLAVDEANRAGGWNGVPFRLVARWSENPWGSGVSQVARMVYEDDVLALLGSVDGAATHLAEQVVAKARLPLVSPVATDDSVNLAGVPWMFSLAPSDSQWAPALARTLVETTGDGSFGLLAVTDHDSRLATRALLAELAALDRGPALRLDLSPGVPSLDSLVSRRGLLEQRALVLVAGPADGARLLSDLRRLGYRGTVFGSPRLARHRCLAIAGDAADGLRVPWLGRPTSRRERDAEFAAAFRHRAGHDPDWAATLAYDATRILLEAIRTAGLSRVDVRRALAELSPWQGVSGPVDWDATGQNRRPVTTVATVRGGRLTVD